MSLIHETADVADSATIGSGTSVWHIAQIREDAVVGDDCVVGRGAYVGSGVSVGSRTKIQNYALVYEPARLGSGVFIGPAVVLTNDVYPRAVDPDLNLKRATDWNAAGVTIDDGAAIGARSVVLAGVSVGAWSLVAAGSVVIRDVPAHAMVAGNPAVHKGWVGRTGRRLRQSGDGWLCDDTGDRFRLVDGVMQVLDAV